MPDPDRPQRPVHEDMHFQTISWTLQRIGWIAAALLAVLALTGVFSHGFFSNAVVRQDGFPLTVTYERFQRMTVLHRFDISMPPGTDDEIRLTFNKVFWNLYEIDSIQPQPARSSANGGEFVLSFDMANRDGFSAVIWARPRSFGYAALEIGTSRGALDVPVIVYP